MSKVGSAHPKILLEMSEINKSEDQVKEFIYSHKKNNKMIQVFKQDANHARDTVWIPRDIDNPIESWITLAEASVKETKIPQNSMDCSHLLFDAMSTIIKEEKHPKSEDCNGVDYAFIYQFIYDLMNGEVPKEPPNYETQLKIFEAMSDLKRAVCNSEEFVEDEKSLLEKFTLRDVNTLNVPFAGKCDDSSIEKFTCLPKINPLNITPALYVKKIVPKL